MRRILVCSAVLGATMALGACGGGSTDVLPVGAPSVAASGSPTAGADPGVNVGPTASAAISSTPVPTDPAQPPTAGPSVAPSELSTESRSVPPPAAVIQVTRVDVRVSDGVEQLVVGFEGGIPGWSARYVDFVRIDGDPVLVDGTVALELVLESADPTGDQGLAEAVAVDLFPELDLIREVRYVYYLGDQITYAIGMVDRAEFKVDTEGDSLVFSFVAS